MSTPAVPIHRRIAWDLCAALLAYVAVRALLLHTNFDEVALWMYELYPMGTMAEFLRRGIDFPLHFYYDNAAGQILSGVLTVPCFALAGSSYLSLKLVPFGMGIGVLLLSWRLLLVSHGRLAANLAAWSLVLAPATYFKYSLTSSGNHFENLFFSMLALAAFARLVQLGSSRGRLFVFGLAAGFALFVFLGALLPLGILVGLHVCIRGLRSALRELPWVAGGLLVGQLPLLVLNLATGGRGLGFLGNKFGGENSAVAGGAVLERIGEYLWTKPPIAPTCPDALGVSGASWSSWFAGALALSWIAALVCALRGLRREGRAGLAAEWPLSLYVLYVPLSALAYGISNLRLGGLWGSITYGGYRYYLPWFLYGMLAAAVLAAKAWRARGAWRTGVALVPLGVLLPGLSSLALVDWNAAQTGLGWRYTGHDLSKTARGLLSARNAVPHAEQLRYIEGFPPLVRASVARGIGYVLALRGDLAKPGDKATLTIDLCQLDDQWPAPLRRELARGAGIGLRFSINEHDLRDVLPALRRTVASSAACAELLPAFLEGLASCEPGLPMSSRVESLSDENGGGFDKARELGLPENVLRGLVRGEGFLFGQLLRRGITREQNALWQRCQSIPAEYREEFFSGLGQGCALEGETPDGPGAGFSIPANLAPAFWGGFVGELRQAYGSEQAELEPLLAALAGRLPADQSEGLRAAIARR